MHLVQIRNHIVHNREDILPGQQEDFISSYMRYTDATEVPGWYSRWAAICGVGALLSRNYYFEHGHFKVNPNMYTMLIGEPGTKKSTAIKTIKKILRLVDYTTFAPNKTSKEKFLAKLADQAAGTNGQDIIGDILEQNIFGDSSSSLKGPVNCFICADEFNNFLGNGNIEFISILGELWDYEGLYENELKNSKSDFIPDPTISILSGNTQTNFQLAFPPETLGQGFFSRLLLIYCDTERPKLTFPPTPDHEQTKELLDQLVFIRKHIQGPARLTSTAMALLDKIYKTWTPISDPRFTHYSNRRLSHLIKLALVYCASTLQTVVEEYHIVYANTVLSHAENFMPAALGEFGKAKNSDVSHKVLKTIETHFLTTGTGITFKELWTYVHKDLDDIRMLGELLKNLAEADKLQRTEIGFLPKRRVLEYKNSDMLDWSILSEEEKRISR